ncbi:hypothetical protein ACIQ9E_08795 [Streptomyces sp. NPDC094448]|uniref:hypothetical protein n=1 Tax=Streptomyces sp. NPDC094448 TaxID=3366063 RepID=UPI0037FDC0B3
MNAVQTSQEPELDSLRRALDVLVCWRVREWSGVARLAGDVGPLVQDWLRDSGVWESLPVHSRAALYWCVADGRAVRRAWHVDPGAEGYGERVTALVMDVAYFAAVCDPVGAGRWPEADPERTRHALLAVELLGQFGKLPVAWRAAVLRELHRAARLRDPARRPLAEVLAEASVYAIKGEDPPGPEYADLRTVDAPELVQRIARLPRGWRGEAFRRIAAGADPMTVEAAARDAIRAVCTTP